MAQLSHRADENAPFFDDIYAAHRFNACGLPQARRYADPIALDNPTTLIRDDVSNFSGIQAAVDLPGERFQLTPNLLLT
jgi:hypothetical protein